MNKVIRFFISQLATMMMNEKVWKSFKKVVVLLSNEELSGAEKKQKAVEMIRKEFGRIKKQKINLGIELAVAYLEYK